MKGDVIRARVTSRKPPYVFGTQSIVWRLRLVKTVPKYELPKFHTFMKATSPLASRECKDFCSNITFIKSSIPTFEGSAELSPGERSCITFAMYWKTTSSNIYMN
jgi:hypothetical protein